MRHVGQNAASWRTHSELCVGQISANIYLFVYYHRSIIFDMLFVCFCFSKSVLLSQSLSYTYLYGIFVYSVTFIFSIL